ncbi:oligosaccharide flippase family protein [Enterococcus dongliensis]|uniref:lipopolysaccharide biosynthesis protein n=1 Tax=Enterococcus dongliensis TaxID=2559925 RepID=UPI00288C7A11|nr:oligosaccharide flippase family protein [Enterococcus dongliensis]MDT2634761.1 oligosaccharide flippase family protein [Enterococcus dongliensis]MDT2669258.1 oligosaccharide flippase family protein [Enterococcus dongliensis]
MKKIFSNLIYNAMYQLFMIIVPVITIPYVSRVLGAYYIGDYTYFSSIILFLGSLIIFGKNQQGVKEIAQSSFANRKQIFYDEWIIQIVASVPLIIINYVWFSLVTDSIVFLLYLPYLLSYIFDISWFYIGIGDIKKIILRNTFIKIISIVFIFIFVKDVSDYSLYILINTFGAFLSNLVFFISLTKYFDNLIPAKIRINRAYLKESLQLLISIIAVQIYTNVDKPIVGFLSDSISLAYYSQSQKIARIILSVVVSFSTIIMPKLAELKGQGNEKAMITILKKSLNYTTIISILFTALLILNAQDFVPWFFGDEFSPMIIDMVISSFLVLFISVGGVFSSQYTLANGDYKKYTIPIVIGAVVNVILLFILTPIFNAVGAILAIVLTELIICLSRIFIVKRDLNIFNIFKDHIIYYISFFITMFMFMTINFSIISNSFFRMFLRSLSICVVYLTVIFLFDKNIRSDLKKMKIKKE